MTLKVKVIKSTVKMATIMQSLKDLDFTLSDKKGNLKVFFKWGNLSIISLQHVWKSKIVVYLWSMWGNQKAFKVKNKNIKFSVETDCHCCDLEAQSRSLKVVWMGKPQWVLPLCKVWHLSYIHTHSVWENRNVKLKVFVTYGQSPTDPASRLA